MNDEDADPGLENEDENEFALVQDLIDDDVMPMYALRIAIFMESDGSTGYRIKGDGEIHMPTMIGILEMVKAQALAG